MEYNGEKIGQESDLSLSHDDGCPTLSPFSQKKMIALWTMTCLRFVKKLGVFAGEIRIWAPQSDGEIFIVGIGTLPKATWCVPFPTRFNSDREIVANGSVIWNYDSVALAVGCGKMSGKPARQQRSRSSCRMMAARKWVLGRGALDVLPTTYSTTY